MERLKPCPFCGCGDRRVGIRRMGNNGYRICCSKCGSLGPHVSVKEWNGQKELHRKKQEKNGMKGREKMDREELMSELEGLFRDEPDNNKLNAVLDLADAYAEHEYEERRKSEKVQWGKDVCDAAGEDVDELPEQVFISVSEKLEDRMLENNGDLEYSVVQEVVNEFWEQEAEEEDADCKSE